MELYNLATDIGETTNLFEEHPEKAKQLAEVLSKHLKEVGAQMPIDKATGKKVAYPIELWEDKGE